MNLSFDVVALGELLIDFTEAGLSEQGNPLFEANPGGAPCNVLAMLNKLGRRCTFVGKVGRDMFGDQLRRIVQEAGCFSLTDVTPGDRVELSGVTFTVMPARHPVPAVGYRAEENGIRFGYTGDTNTLPALAEAYRGCRLLLADGLFPTAQWAEGKPHLSAALAAELAAAAGAEKLILTHLHPVYPPELLLQEARARFPEAVLAEAGRIFEI